MSRRRAFQMAVCLALALSVQPVGSATAAPESRQLSFRLNGSHGYDIGVVGRGATAYIGVARTDLSIDKGIAESLYIARAKTSATRLEATFGDLGRVSVRFHPSGKVEHGRRHRGCRGPDRYTTRFGVFVGSVRFRGEDGYTAAGARRVKGAVVSPAILHCRFFAPPPSPTRVTVWNPPRRPALDARGLRSQALASGLLDHLSEKLTTLQASWRLGLAAQSFGAFGIGNRAVFFAASLQAEGRLAAYRLAFAIGSDGSFGSNDALSVASVEPPRPFSGSATFQHFDDGTKSWAGPLAVSFPGAPRVPLTGPLFEVRLNRGL
jgi:hypothetical protein